jgi:hypothetical protein
VARQHGRKLITCGSGDVACGCGTRGENAGHGLVGACYRRWLYHGRPGTVPPPTRPAYLDPVDDRIEDYLFIAGDRLSARQAAIRLGLAPRTVCRYRRRLREEAMAS